MSPSVIEQEAASGAEALLNRLRVQMGTAVREERQRRRLTIRALAAASGISPATIHAIEAGTRGSMEAYTRLSHYFGLELAMELTDTSRISTRREDADLVHATMGELEASVLGGHGFPVAVDEPWQHYQFAGRADVAAWDVERRALLHLENRTRFPDVQDAIGRFASKRSYLGPVLAKRIGLHGGFHSETHVMVALWSAEVLRDIRRTPATFRSVGAHGPDGFEGWWRGEPPQTGRTSAVVLLDPFATGRQRRIIGLDEALDGARPRLGGYADAAQRIRSTSR